jgi:hypothetical protein
MLNKFLISLTFLIVLFFIQQMRLISIGGINPNFILIALTAVGFFRIYRGLTFVILIFAVFGVVVLFSDTFWVFHFAVIALLALAVYALGPCLTGNPLWDFVIFLTAGHFLFYVFTNISRLGSFPWAGIFAELGYNLVLGLLVASIAKPR